MKTGERWFVEAMDDYTNEVITSYFAASGRSADDGVKSSKRDLEGKPHQLWEMPVNDIKRLVNSKRNCRLDFKIFVMQADGGNLVREISFAVPRGSIRKTIPTGKARTNLLEILGSKR